MSMSMDEIREAALNDLAVFIRLVSPHLALSKCHYELIEWWTSSARKDNIMVLYPRGHLKSQLVSHKTVWELTKDPTETILYVSATASLAEAQLYQMKNILTSPVYTKYFPDMVNREEAKRERWNTSEIMIDHPARAKAGIRDASIMTAGLTTNITGFHASKVKLDDVVVPKNAYTEEGRQSVAAILSQIASIKNPDATMDCVGTRYHAKDQYNTFMNQMYMEYDDEGEPMEEIPLWDIRIDVVEKDGNYLWERKREPDGKWYGFSAAIMSKKRAEYEDKTQFYAQYYQNANMAGTGRITRDKFQYYERKFLKNENGKWWIHGKRLNVYAAMDFAFSLRRKADYTALLVIGVDSDNQYYVLDINRFKSDRISDYFQAIISAYSKWGFRTIRCEVTVAQQVIVTDLKNNYIVPNNIPLSVDEFRPSKSEGTKEERMSATLEPKYDNKQIWHYLSGDITSLEEELLAERPQHDDLKDALTAAIDVAEPPIKSKKMDTQVKQNVIYNSRFGGVAFRKGVGYGG